MKNKFIFCFIAVIFSLTNFSCFLNDKTSSDVNNILKNINIVINSNFTNKTTSITDSIPFTDPDQYTDAFITPSEYSVALKKVSLIKTDNSKVDLLKTNTLSSSKKLDFINDSLEQKLDVNSIPEGEYNGILFEIYYLQMKFPINNAVKNIRVYLSDDEVFNEGQHHQGDITIVGSNNQEIGWFKAPDDFSGTLPRPANQGFAAGTDPQTGHDRGPFGGPEFWNTEHPENIFTQIVPLNLNTSSISKIKITFNVKDTWFYDDVDGNGIFSPGPNSSDDANDTTKHWAPLFPGIQITTE